MDPHWIEAGQPFLQWIDRWYRELPAAKLDELIATAGGPERVVVFAEDVVRGFCEQGPLSSPRVKAIVAPIRQLFQAAHAAGVRRFVLPQDCHPADSPEFEQYGPHCVAGSAEAETMPELALLPFADQFEVIPKRSINPFLESGLEEWFQQQGGLSLAIVTGDCTDLCAYQLPCGLKWRANARGEGLRVVVPENCVQTYHLPVDATPPGLMPHHGDFLHHVFLYHMALNGVEVVREIG